MKRAVALFMCVVFLLSVSGCTPKSEYDKLMDEKAAIEKKCNDITSAKARMADEIAAQKKEIAELKDSLSKASASAKDLERELLRATANTKKLEAEIEKLKQAQTG